MFKKRKKALWVLILLFVLGTVLAACGGGQDADEAGGEEAAEDSEEKKVPSEPQEGGTLIGAMDTAPAGVFNRVFYEEAYEDNILNFTHEALVGQKEDLEFIPELAKEWEFNDDQTEATFYLEEGVKWHDGEEFTADDVVFTYQVMADPDYVKAGGVRTEYVQLLKGFEAYNAGETDAFEGVVADDDYTVTFHFEEPNINPFYYASFDIIPKHVFEDIPVIDMPEAPESLDPGKVIGTGPFKFTDMVEREQYVLERHDDYWKGKPYLDKVVWRVVEQSVMTGLLETGEIDFIGDPTGLPASEVETVKGYGNIEIFEQPDFGFQLLGFKLNHRTDEDVEDGVIDPDNWVENEKIADQKVRQAIAYAVNREGLIGEEEGEGLLHGHGEKINSPIATQFWAYDETAAIDYSYNPEKAEELLDEAGYVDTDGDGFREDPDGGEWVLNLDYPLGNELRERAAPVIKENLEAVGISVNMRQPKEMTAYIEELTNDNTDWDLYLLGWNLASGDPDPIGLWASEDAYNYSRWNNEESDELLFKAITAPEAFEQDYREEVYAEWQHLFSEDLPALLLFAQNKIYAYTDRLQNVNPLPYQLINDPHEWWLLPGDE